MVYNLTNSITVICDVIDNQRELGELFGKTYTPSQTVDLAFLVISNYLIFRDYVRRWICQQPVDQTYPNLVVFVQGVHVELREKEASVDELGF